MDPLISLKTISDDDFQVEFDLLPVVELSDLTSERRQIIQEGLLNADKQLEIAREKLEELNKEIDHLTNHADALDYSIAVISGVIAGMVDSFLVGKTEIDKEKIQKALEDKYHTPNDRQYKHENEDGGWTDSAQYHRLDDLAHHPTPLGLVAAILVRYFRLVIFIDGTDGNPHIFFADKSKDKNTLKLERDQLIKAWIGAIFSGICLWLTHMVEQKYAENNDEEMPEPLRKLVKALGSAPALIELLKTADTWAGHMMSDVSTSQGIPNVFLSLLKELSALPILRDTKLPEYVKNLYKSGKHNLSEWGGVVFVAAKKQALPVLINEAIVRGFYFIRRMIMEYQEHENLKDMDWEKVIPFGNRTVERMMTISCGTFTAIDLADAAIRSATDKTTIDPATFFTNMVLRVNFVGVGRFAIAIVTDIGMGIKKSQKEYERGRVLNDMIYLTNVKVYYREADLECSFAELQDKMVTMHSAEANVWKQLEFTQESMDALYKQIGATGKVYIEAIQSMDESFDEIEGLLPDVEAMNPGLLDEMLRRLK